MSDSLTVEGLADQLAVMRETLHRLRDFVDEADGWTSGLPLAHVPGGEATRLIDFVPVKAISQAEFELWLRMMSNQLNEARKAMDRARQSTSEFMPLFAYPKSPGQD